MTEDERKILQGLIDDSYDQFVNAVAKLAEKEWHHPDIDIRWNKVMLTLTTHDAGGLTDRDFSLAKKFNQI